MCPSTCLPRMIEGKAVIIFFISICFEESGDMFIKWQKYIQNLTYIMNNARNNGDEELCTTPTYILYFNKVLDLFTILYCNTPLFCI